MKKNPLSRFLFILFSSTAAIPSFIYADMPGEIPAEELAALQADAVPQKVEALPLDEPVVEAISVVAEHVDKSSDPTACCHVDDTLLKVEALPLDESVVEAISVVAEHNDEQSDPIHMPPSIPFCYFVPPKGWEIAKPDSLGKQVKMAFIKKSTKELFCPSLNLAVEQVDCSLSEYLSDVKAIHEQGRKNQWRKLGKVHTASGDAQLTEIDTTSHLGPVRMLQLILMKEDRAYIVTAAALRRDFCNFYREFQEAFHSLTITQDLFESIPQLDRRTSLKAAQEALFTIAKAMPKNEQDPSLLSQDAFQKVHWKPFEKKILEDFEDMGAFWQTLVLINARQALQEF